MPRNSEKAKRAKAEGRCANCLVAWPADGRTRCERCRQLQRDRDRRKKDALYAEAIALFPHRCACPGCPETEWMFLTFDHIHNDGWVDDANGRANPKVRLRRVIANPERYQLLCYNCNCAKGAGGGGACPLEGTDHRANDGNCD